MTHKGNKREDSKLFVLLGITGRGFIPPTLIKKSLGAKGRAKQAPKHGFADQLKLSTRSQTKNEF